MFAACGTPLVAARGGKVKFTGFHAAAGYYVVIDGKGTGTDYAYMHLRQRAAVRVGDAIYTGQDLGEVGETGNARAATSTSRNGRPPAGTTAGDPSTRCRTSSAGTESQRRPRRCAALGASGVRGPVLETR